MGDEKPLTCSSNVRESSEDEDIGDSEVMELEQDECESKASQRCVQHKLLRWSGVLVS